MMVQHYVLLGVSFLLDAMLLLGQFCGVTSLLKSNDNFLTKKKKRESNDNRRVRRMPFNPCLRPLLVGEKNNGKIKKKNTKKNQTNMYQDLVFIAANIQLFIQASYHILNEEKDLALGLIYFNFDASHQAAISLTQSQQFSIYHTKSNYQDRSRPKELYGLQ